MGRSILLSGYNHTANGKINEEIIQRTRKASQVYYQLQQTVINKKEVSLKTKLQIYNSIYVPTMIYGLESVVLKEKNTSL